MKRETLEYLICPACLPEENSLRLRSFLSSSDGEIIEGSLECVGCEKSYPISEGIACLMEGKRQKEKGKSEEAGDSDTKNRSCVLRPGSSVYETPEVLSAYLWTQYADLFGDPDVTGAYCQWAGQIAPVSGAALDAGCATGRFSFEMSVKCDLVIGVDVSMSFVATARRIMRERTMAFGMREEGLTYSQKSFTLPPEWDSAKVDFVAADAEALPFRSGSFACVASLNVIDKTPGPLEHIQEVCRTARAESAQLFLSDPFSWSEKICAPEKWLGGAPYGRFSGAGIDNLARLLSEEVPAALAPAWRVARTGAVWWKIRNHRNHFELVRSQFIKAER